MKFVSNLLKPTILHTCCLSAIWLPGAQLEGSVYNVNYYVLLFEFRFESYLEHYREVRSLRGRLQILPLILREFKQFN